MIQRTQPYLTGLAHLRLHVIFFQGILRTRDETLLKNITEKDTEFLDIIWQVVLQKYLNLFVSDDDSKMKCCQYLNFA